MKNLDECGGYLPEMLSLLEKSPFLSQVNLFSELVRTPCSRNLRSFLILLGSTVGRFHNQTVQNAARIGRRANFLVQTGRADRIVGSQQSKKPVVRVRSFCRGRCSKNKDRILLACRNSSEIEAFLNERKKNMGLNDEKKMIVEELKKYRRSGSAREFLFEDRTRPHADQAWSNSFEATAAVGT